MDSGNRLFGGRYRADNPLGKGGFSVVFHATDTKSGRAVALKVLHSTNVRDDASQRFAREASIVQQLTHPNTVRLYDFGTEANGTQYIVYELVQGETLSQLIRQGPVPADRTVHIALQVLKALHEAHQLGVIHRDIKPANIMLLQYAGDRDVVKVLDFGIAKPTTNATRALTETGMLIGTPRFMSPEQARGEPVGPPSDLYSLALVLAEMLSGQRVLQGDAMEVLLAHISPDRLELPPVAARGPLGPVLEKALEKDVGRRYPGALEMLADLEALAPRLSMPQPATMTGPQTATMPGPQTATMTGPQTATMPGPQTAPMPGPGIAAAYPPPQAITQPAATPSKASRLPWILAALGSLLVLGIGAATGAFFYMQSRTAPAAPATQVTSATPTATHSQALASASAAPPAAGVHLHVETTPSGAKLEADGFQVCDKTPCDFRAKKDQSLVLDATLGAKHGQAKVLAQHDQTVSITLQAQHRAAQPKAKSPKMCEVQVDGLMILQPCK